MQEDLAEDEEANGEVLGKGGRWRGVKEHNQAHSININEAGGETQ
jgi:hypothetical protein